MKRLENPQFKSKKPKKPNGWRVCCSIAKLAAH